jgi:flagellar motor switch protein FliN/FliY
MADNQETTAVVDSSQTEAVRATTTTAAQTIPIPDLGKPADKKDKESSSSIDLLKDVELNVKIELGRAKMYVEDILKLSQGSVVELDKLAGDPVDIYVNERLVARGEVLVLNENFCVRVNQIVSDVV